MENITIIKDLLSSSEFSDLQIYFESQNISDEELFDYLLQEKIILMIDWSGEEEEFEISSFLKYRLDKLEKNSDLNSIEIYEQLDEKIDNDQIERGGGVSFLLEKFHKILKKDGLSINLVREGCDAYYITLATQQATKLLQKRKNEFWSFVPFGTKKREILYTIYCTCGSTNVWQLKPNIPLPVKACCDKCNKQLVNIYGEAILEVEKEYI